MSVWISAAEARTRTSAKWDGIPDDVLSLSTAEMDCTIAPPVLNALRDRIDAGDLGYRGSATPLTTAFSAFALRRWGWEVDPETIGLCSDVSAGIVEVLRQMITPGERVVITPPVYGPFAEFVAEAKGVVDAVPLHGDVDSGWMLDLSGIRSALENGARAVIICNPHNPTGLVHSQEDLAALATIAREHGAVVISDEIHAPLTHPENRFTPFLDASVDASEVGITVTSSSKGWNLAGLKCALIVATGTAGRDILRRIPRTVGERCSILGAHAATAVFSEGDSWLDDIVAAIDDNARLLGRLLDASLPQLGYRKPDAGYLAWLDFRRLPWGADPAAMALMSARVGLSNGTGFGAKSDGHARLNFGCSPATLDEAIRRIAAAAGSGAAL